MRFAKHSRHSSKPSGRRRAASSLSLAIVTSTLVVLAANADGTPVSDVSLNDGSVWVTNLDPSRQLLGRLNPQIHQLDLGLHAGSGDFDVFQDGSTVFLDVRSGARGLRRIDVAAGRAGDLIDLPATTIAAFGKDTLAMLDTETGQGWVRTSDTIQGFNPELTPDISVGRGGTVTVGADGTAWFVSRSRRTATPVTIQAGLPSLGEPRELGGKLGTSLQASAVGDIPLVLDRDAATLFRPGADPVQVQTDDPLSIRLQEPGPPSDVVYVATRASLLKGSIEGGPLGSVRDGFDGPPAAPIVHKGYVHAAWADATARAYVRLHGAEVHAEKIPGLAATADLTFRRNRDAVVLNDAVSGVSWLVQEEGLPRVENWDDIDPNVKKQQEDDPNPEEITEARRKQDNRPPIARDDDLGARPGQESILPLVRNDVDLDGDILTISSLQEVKQVSGPKPQRLAVVGDGTQLQVQFAPTEGGKEARFTYVASDGREGGTDEAEVKIRIIPLNANQPPARVKDGEAPRETAVSVARGQRTTIYALPDWTDADGDALILQNADVKSGGTVTFQPDGVIEYADDGNAGTKTIRVQISDGHPGGVTDGKITVNASQNAGVQPALVPDRAMGQAGSWILVEPLANDYSRDGTPLHLRDVPARGGLDIKQDPVSGAFLARTSQSGTYYLDYSAYTDRAEAQSFVRLDVLAKSDTDLPPVAMKDEGLIPPGRHALVDLLANDYDPEAGVLAVTSVSAPTNSGVKASLIQNRMLRVEATRDLASPVSLDYTVTDGPNSTVGSLTVGQGTVSTSNRPPVASDDRVTVRAGAVASLPVLENDFDPDGDDLQLLQQDLVKPDDLALFVSGTRLRFKAPDVKGEYRVTYGVRDSRGQRDDAAVLIEVKPDDPEDNAPPKPEPVEARALGTKPVRIDLGLSASDPDGDAVTLSGLISAPKLGRIVNTGLDWIEYQPFDETHTGTDTFEARVRDKYGATGLLTIRVGVTGRATLNQAPVALDDRLSVRPDRTIAYTVLANDADPDGDAILMSDDVQTAKGTTASIDDQFVVIEIPPVDGAAKVQTAVNYSISDGLGGGDTARLTVDASNDAPLYAPSTRDDVASLAQVAGKAPGDSVVVDVLENDGDLDGRREDLRIEAWDPSVSTVVDGRLSIVLAAADHVVVYRVIDGEEQESFGFVFVSGTDSVPPVLNPDTIPLEVLAGEPREIALSDYVLVRRNRSPIITVPEDVATSPFAGGVEVKTLDRIVVTAPTDYVGPAAVTLEVTDGTDLNDATGLAALLSIPLEVIATGNKPPALRDVNVDLIGGDNAVEKRIDLSVGASDPNPGDVGKLEFSAQGNDKVDARIEKGTVLVVKPKDGVADQEVTDVAIAVTDPAGATGSAVAHVTIVRSDKPLVTVSKIGPLEAEAGRTVTFDIGDYAANPFEGKPLTVSDPLRETGAGVVAAASSTVSITPAARFAGSVTVKFTVHDGSGDPERDVTARAEIVVVAAPEPPGRPTVSNSTHSTVTLSWPPADDKGAQIDKYEVFWNGGSQDCGQAATCQITGLTPGNTYRFWVVATNRVGPSKESAQSDPVTPDKVPERMSAPTISPDYTKRDGQLGLQWTSPENVGSAIRYYEIALLGTTEVRQAPATARSYLWTGLANGESKQFRIRAVNDILDESRTQSWSDASSPDKAFGVPAVVSKPTAAASADDEVSGGIVSVDWIAPPNQGDEIDHYVVTMVRDGGAQPAKVVTGTSASFNVDNGHEYTFSVAAHNRAGLGNPSETSSKVNPYDKATAVRNITKVSEGDRTARISFQPPADEGGRSIVGYRIASDGGPSKTVTTTTADVVFNANNGPYNLSVVPITRDATAGDITGESASLAGVRPYGMPGVPRATASGNATSVTLGWGPPTPQENGRPLTKLEVSIDGSAWQQRALQDSSQTVGNGYSESHSIRVRVTDSEGQTRESSTIAASSGPKPAKWMHIQYVSASSDWIDLEMRNFEPNRTVSVQCWVTPNADGQGGRSVVSFSVTTDGNGYAHRNNGCYLNGGGYGNLRIGPNEIWSNTIALHP